MIELLKVMGLTGDELIYELMTLSSKGVWPIKRLCRIRGKAVNLPEHIAKVPRKLLKEIQHYDQSSPDNYLIRPYA